jgi:diacylglycerol kinase (ATP)
MRNVSIALLINPISAGRDRYTLQNRVVERLRLLHLGFDLYDKEWPEAFDGCTHILLIGGDGTINYFINKYPSNTVPVSLIKGGTGNDFAWKLLGDKSFEEQLQIAINGTPRFVDAGVCNGRYFLNGVGVGFDGAVVRKMNASRRWFKGYLNYYLNVLKVITTYRSVKVTIATDGAPLQTQRTFMLTIANGARFGGNFMVAPRADISDGLLDFVVIGPVAVLKRYYYLPAMKKGKHLCLPFVSSLKLATVSVSSETELAAHLDGELMIAKRFEIQVLPGKFLFRY